MQPLPLNNIDLITSIDDSLFDQLNETYSWNSDTIIVPAYDTTTGANGENITANMGVGPDGVSIISWHVQ